MQKPTADKTANKTNRAVDIIKKMNNKFYEFKSRTKKESTEYLRERFEQLKIEGLLNSPEGRMIKAILQNA